MQEIISWITENWSQILEAYLLLIAAATVIVKLTPTLKDDNILKGLIKFTGKYLALNRK